MLYQGLIRKPGCTLVFGGLFGYFLAKQKVTKIPKEYFDVIKEGMHDVTVIGTAAFIKVPGHDFCAKTGTAQN